MCAAAGGTACLHREEERDESSIENQLEQYGLSVGTVPDGKLKDRQAGQHSSSSSSQQRVMLRKPKSPLSPRANGFDNVLVNNELLST